MVKLKNKKGQLTVYGLIYFITTVLVFWAVNGLLNVVVMDLANNLTAYGNTTGATIVQLIPTMVALVVGLIPVQFAMSARKQQEEGYY